MRMSEEMRPSLFFLAAGAAATLFLDQSAVRAQTSSGPAAFADQLRQIELGRDQALVTGDRSYLDRVIADDYHLVDPFGGIDDKAAEVKSAGSGFYLSLTPGPISVRRAGKEAAILRYQIAAVVKLRAGPFQARFWHTDYYERRKGRWQVVWSQSTEIKQPAAATASQLPKTH